MRSLKCVWPEIYARIEPPLRLVNLDPPTLEAHVAQVLDDIYSVQVNGRTVETFMLMPGRKTVRFVIPAGTAVERVQIAAKPASWNGAMGRLEFKGAAAAHGPEALLQQFIRLCHTRPKTICGHPDVWGLPELNEISPENRVDALRLAMLRIEQLIKRNQQGQKYLTPGERLVSIDVIEVADMVTGDHRVRVQLNTQAGSVIHQLSWGK